MVGAIDTYNVLITGASGLVGQHITQRLSSDKNISVIAQARSYTLKLDNGSCIQLGLEEPGAEDILVGLRPDAIIHCAALIPTATISANVAAEVNRGIDRVVCGVADRCGAPIVFVSSVSVYENAKLPWKEIAEVHPDNSYAKQKKATEMCIAALNCHNTSMRISSPYGGKQSAERNVLYKFIHAAIQGLPLEIYGTGVRQQDFIYADDVADAVFSIIANNLTGKNVGGIYNIASGSAVSMRELAELIIHIAGCGEIIHTTDINEQEGFPPRIDISKAKTILEWQPHTSLALGLEQTIASIRGVR